MTPVRSSHCRILALAAALCGVSPALGGQTGWPLGLVVVQGAAAVDEDRAAARAQADTGGRVLSIRYAELDGTPCYLVKILLPDGRVTVVAVDAETGTLR